MKRTLAALWLVGTFGAVGCGSDDKGETSTPQAACHNIVAELCSKYWGCLDKNALALIPNVVGANEADCRTLYEQNECTDQKLKCDSGQTYNSAKAQECLDQFRSFSCSQFGRGTRPAACSAICG